MLQNGFFPVAVNAILTRTRPPEASPPAQGHERRALKGCSSACPSTRVVTSAYRCRQGTSMLALEFGPSPKKSLTSKKVLHLAPEAAQFPETSERWLLQSGTDRRIVGSMKTSRRRFARVALLHRTASIRALGGSVQLCAAVASRGTNAASHSDQNLTKRSPPY